MDVDNKSKLYDVAKSLLEAVDGLVTDSNIDGVIKVFEGIKEGCDEVWTDYLLKDLNEVIFMNNITCDVCGEPICVKRTRQKVRVSTQETKQ